MRRAAARLAGGGVGRGVGVRHLSLGGGVGIRRGGGSGDVGGGGGGGGRSLSSPPPPPPPLPSKPIFYDMLHSNNAARIRLWISLKGDMRERIDTRTISYADLTSPDFQSLNPLRKVPALVRGDGEAVFESDVILSYLEDKYGWVGASFTPETPEARQEMRLIIRCHDLYVASPNTTEPGFSHSQGAMYLSREWHGAARGMEAPTRAAKLRELSRQLRWLEERQRVQQARGGGGGGGGGGGSGGGGSGGYLVGDQLSLADLTWFPTAVFMEFMLPRFFGWPALFDPNAQTPTPALASWYARLREAPAFAQVHGHIWTHWEKMEAEGQFEPILKQLRAAEGEGHRFGFEAV